MFSALLRPLRRLMKFMSRRKTDVRQRQEALRPCATRVAFFCDGESRLIVPEKFSSLRKEKNGKKKSVKIERLFS